MQSQPETLIAELELALRTGSSEQRTNTLRKVTDLFLNDADRLNEEQIKVFDAPAHGRRARGSPGKSRARGKNGIVEGREVVAAFDGGAISSDAGALLLGATDRAIAMMDFLVVAGEGIRVRTPESPVHAPNSPPSWPGAGPHGPATRSTAAPARRFR